MNRAFLRKALNLSAAAFAVFAAIALKGAWDTYELSRRPAPKTEPAGDDPVAARLEARVRRLSVDIGRRNYRYPIGLAAAKSFVEGELTRAGYDVRRQSYTVHPAGFEQLPMDNLIAVLPADAADAPILVIGAHYDTAYETPGADDNATGVAVLIELAQALRRLKSRFEIRFVAYSTEEPPFFGTASMGSAVNARSLKAEGRSVAGMIGLEMLGYYDSSKGSQKYPLFLSPFFPDTGDYVGIVSNLASRDFLKSVARGFAAPRGTRAISASLPEWIGEITLSDHKNYWDNGFPAVMATDTAFLRNVHYHQTNDTAEKLDYARMADVARGLEAAISSFAAAR